MPRGLAHLLSFGLRVLTFVEYAVRDHLEAAGEALEGLNAGSPQRQTSHPTAERLLSASRGITLAIVRLPECTIRHATPCPICRGAS